MTSSPSFSRQEREDLLYTLSPIRYARSINLYLYDWQHDVVTSENRFIVINGARRGGKSFIISFEPCHEARFNPGSVTLITAPTEAQAVEDMRFIRGFMARDLNYPEIIRSSDRQIELSNKSRIIVMPATEVSARGYPNPNKLIVDEAGFIPRVIFEDCLIPMLNGNLTCRMLVISSPHGKSGDPGRFFYETFQDKKFDRFEVRAPFDIDRNDPTNLVSAVSEPAYKARKAKDGIRAYYSPRHTDYEEQMFALSKQGVLKYSQNQLGLFVEPEDQVFSFDEIERSFRPGLAPLEGKIMTASLKAFNFPALE